PWLGLLTDDVWLRNAQHANRAAPHLGDAPPKEGKMENALPVGGNAVFVRMNKQPAGYLQSRGWHFYKFVELDIYRLMCSWSTTDKAISDFIADINTINH